jgi:hypothetical protein
MKQEAGNARGSGHRCICVLLTLVLGGGPAAGNAAVTGNSGACPTGMVLAPLVDGISGETHDAASGQACVCPVGTYDWHNGFIFCFDSSKLYGNGEADLRPSTADDVAFRVTYGSQYDLPDGWNRYDVQLPSAASQIVGSQEEYAECMGDTRVRDERKRAARCMWSRSSTTIDQVQTVPSDPPFLCRLPVLRAGLCTGGVGTNTAAQHDDDADWRFELDPDHDLNVPGLLRLQNPHIFTPVRLTHTHLPESAWGRGTAHRWQCCAGAVV